eukprot:TRINITY_DN555_c0_g1_i4.p1 TRINITY_DN555_c0_g1~~TRINITY_DN555_c0_g1_i4.p1  ORF type:complete len:118 (-),score=52.80 TRINITY_DN555_c0_g1_i4:57-410(-)
MSGKGNKNNKGGRSNKGGGGGGGGGRGGGGPPEGKGKGHALKPRQRRDAKTEETSADQKKIDRLRDDLGGLVEMISDAELSKLLKKYNGDVEQVKDYIFTNNGVIEVDDDDDEDEDD